MIEPCGHRVLVQQLSYEDHDDVFKSAKAAGIEIVKDQNVRYQASVDTGTVVKIGSTAWKDFGGNWASIGDEVVFVKNAGRKIEDPDSPDSHFVILNDEDIVAVVRKTK